MTHKIPLLPNESELKTLGMCGGTEQSTDGTLETKSILLEKNVYFSDGSVQPPPRLNYPFWRYHPIHMLGVNLMEFPILWVGNITPKLVKIQVFSWEMYRNVSFTNFCCKFSSEVNPPVSFS